jgi:uncharacterized membrane protein
MQNEFRERQRRTSANMRMVKDITMAIVILGVGVLLFFAPQLGLQVQLDKGFRIALAVLFGLYGGFRLYRGLKRDY